MIRLRTYEQFLSEPFAMGNKASVLPGMEDDQLVKEDSLLAVCEGYVINLSGFYHPGGVETLIASRGRDITKDMEFHSRDAVREMRARRIAVYMPNVLKSVSTGRGKNDVLPA